MITKTTIKFQLVEDVDGWLLVPCDDKGRMPAALTDRVALTGEQKLLWQDYTGEEDGAPYHWDEVVKQEFVTKRIAQLVACKSRDHSKGKRKDSFHVFLFGYTVQSVVVSPDPVPQNLIDALDGWSSHRGNKEAHCCLTGKDADLESHGQQDITVDGILNGFAICTITVGKTFAGDDVSLNLPEGTDNDEEFYLKTREEWLNQAQEVVCGCGMAGEWTGDDWYMHEAIEFRVKLRATATETAKAIIDKAEKVVAPLEKELRMADNILEQLAGWRDRDGKHLPEGKPGKGSIGFYLANKATFPSEEEMDWKARNEQA